MVRRAEGPIPDDTQVTMWVTESIIALVDWARMARDGEIREDLVGPDDLARQFSQECVP